MQIKTRAWFIIPLANAGSGRRFRVGQTTHSTGPFPSDAPDVAWPPNSATRVGEPPLFAKACSRFVCLLAGWLVNLVGGGLVGGRARARCLGGGLMGGLGCWLVVGGLVGSGLAGRSVGG